MRHSSKRVRFEANGFYYHIKDFVFLAPTGDIEDDLIVAEYRQGTTRYTGTEAGWMSDFILVSGSTWAQTM